MILPKKRNCTASQPIYQLRWIGRTSLRFDLPAGREPTSPNVSLDIVRWTGVTCAFRGTSMERSPLLTVFAASVARTVGIANLSLVLRVVGSSSVSLNNLLRSIT
jgi:hypothetical protein